MENQNVYDADEDYINKLQLFHYNDCNNESNQVIKDCRGVVKSNDNIVSKSFGYIDEYTVGIDDEKICKKVHSLNQSKIYNMYEGTIVRMFFWKHKWFLSTHKKLNAFNSKWGNSNCKTFGEMFIDSICNEVDKDNVNNKYDENNDLWNKFDSFCFQLDVNKTYVFLLIHDETTSMVCKNTNSQSCYHIGEFDISTHLLVEGNTSGLPSLPCLSFNNTLELIEYVKNMDYLIHPGVILYFPNQTQIKLFNSSYKEAQKLRGNQPDMLYRYLEIRKNKELSEKFLNLYKDDEHYLMSAEITLLNVSREIFQAYMNRYIHKRYVYIPKCEHLVMQMCHKWHNEDRDHNKISINKVFDVLENLPTKMLYSIVKNHM